MWASKLIFSCKTSKCGLLKSSWTLPRAFSSLNYLTQHLKKSCKPVHTSQLFRQRKVKGDLIRIKSTVALDQTVLQQQRAIARRRQIGFWLLVCCGSVHVAINIGGYTRLTESGLSMVTWKFTFEKIPKTEEEWSAEFAKYQQFPEFQQLKKDLTLEQFKEIFLVEFFHRFWGRALGLMFFIPAASFWIRGYFSRVMKARIAVYGSLIVAQGLLGWHMVKSGLENRFNDESDIPRVSQYRLAAHLALALTLYVGFLWTALDHILSPQTVPALTNGIKRLRAMAGSCKGFVFLTALSGALVAGLDAGLIYNSFPKMGEKWIPGEILDFSPVLKNFTENPTTVQFDHRILGITTVTLAIATWVLSKREKLPPRLKLAVNVFAFFACCQVALGISTVVHNVPTNLALAHQSGSVFLLAAATWLVHELSRLRFIPK